MAKDFVNPKVVDGYDEHIRKLIPGYELIHQQVNAILESRLEDKMHPHILVVGCGTGYELQYLLQKHPCWRFTAIDPSLTMLEKAKHDIAKQHELKHVRFLHGDTSVLHEGMQFDAAIAILVAHFVPHQEKPKFFQDIAKTLKKNALLMTYDLTEVEHQDQLRALQLLCQHNGLTSAQTSKMLERLEDDFALVSSAEYAAQLSEAGFDRVQPYMQVMNYQGFMAVKA